jgi:2-polyprenyl-6-methoxyphenol hydroxylase-like FAD-dependent oxidoreductase
MVNGDALAESLAREPDVETGLSAWEAERREVTDRIQRSSVRIDTLTTGYPRAFASLRRFALRRLGWRT